MKLFNSLGPNPHVVRMFIAEKGLSIPMEQLDVLKNENRGEAHLKRNPHGQTPALELDNGQFLSEITAICEYLEDKFPNPPLVGTNAEEKAETRMWTRRVDLNICEPLTNGYRYSGGLALFKDRMVTLPEAAEGLKRVAADRLKWLDGQMNGKEFLCGKRFTLADILLYCFVTFGIARGQALAEENKNLHAWLKRVGDRPSAKA
jgi:glutathione S-transferase